MEMLDLFTLPARLGGLALPNLTAPYSLSIGLSCCGCSGVVSMMQHAGTLHLTAVKDHETTESVSQMVQTSALHSSSRG